LERELSRVDESLKKLLIDGVFVWDPEFEEDFPKEKFWYLYHGGREVMK
jgi:hypothetical protein